MEKQTFEQLDPELQEQIMFELCQIGEYSVSYAGLINIEKSAREWIKTNNEPKTADEWQVIVMARDSLKQNISEYAKSAFRID